MPKFIIRVLAVGKDDDDAFDKVKDALEFSEVETWLESFGPAPEDHWADHERVEDWIIAVKDGTTRLGFWEWLNTQTEDEEPDELHEPILASCASHA